MTNITPELQRAFEALTSGDFSNFALVSCFADGALAAAIRAVIQIDNLPATDTAGYAGLEDEVDFHTWRLIKGVVLSTLLGVGTELSLGGEESDDPGSGSGASLVRALRESTQQNANRAGQRITERNLNIQPTITVRPGWPLRVIVHKDLVFR